MSTKRKDRTTLFIHTSTKEKLAKHLKWGDSMDLLLNKLVDFYESKQDKN